MTEQHLSFFGANFLRGYLNKRVIMSERTSLQTKKDSSQVYLHNHEFYWGYLQQCAQVKSSFTIEEISPYQERRDTFEYFSKTVVQTSSHLVLRFSIRGFYSFWGQMSLSQGSPKIMGKHKLFYLTF